MEAFNWNANTATRSASMSAMASTIGIFGNSTDAVAAGVRLRYVANQTWAWFPLSRVIFG